MALEGTGNMGKRIVSRLRPNYIAVCQPKDMESLCPVGSQNYVSNYSCMGSSDPDEHYAFPSGHSSHSSYIAFIIIFYLHYRSLSINYFKYSKYEVQIFIILKHFIQLLVVALSVFVCLSRVRDFKHRLSDITGGILLGILFGHGIIYFVLSRFTLKKENNNYEIL